MDFRQAGERWGLATSLTYLGFAQTILGDFDGAIVALEESVRLTCVHLTGVNRQVDPRQGGGLPESFDQALCLEWVAHMAEADGARWQIAHRSLSAGTAGTAES